MQSPTIIYAKMVKIPFFFSKINLVKRNEIAKKERKKNIEEKKDMKIGNEKKRKAQIIMKEKKSERMKRRTRKECTVVKMIGDWLRVTTSSHLASRTERPNPKLLSRGEDRSSLKYIINVLLSDSEYFIDKKFDLSTRV